MNNIQAPRKPWHSELPPQGKKNSFSKKVSVMFTTGINSIRFSSLKLRKSPFYIQHQDVPVIPYSYTTAQDDTKVYTAPFHDRPESKGEESLKLINFSSIKDLSQEKKIIDFINTKFSNSPQGTLPKYYGKGQAKTTYGVSAPRETINIIKNDPNNLKKHRGRIAVIEIYDDTKTDIEMSSLKLFEKLNQTEEGTKAVPKIFSHALIDSRRFIFCQLFTDGNLNECIKNNSLTSLKEKNEIALQIIEAAEILAKHKIVHHDLTPYNILVKGLEEGKKRKSRICDLGFASEEGDPISEDALVNKLVVPYQFSKDLWKSTKYDLWGLGVLLILIYTNKTPEQLPWASKSTGNESFKKAQKSALEGDKIYKKAPEEIKPIIQSLLKLEISAGEARKQLEEAIKKMDVSAYEEANKKPDHEPLPHFYYEKTPGKKVSESGSQKKETVSKKTRENAKTVPKPHRFHFGSWLLNIISFPYKLFMNLLKRLKS